MESVFDRALQIAKVGDHSTTQLNSMFISVERTTQILAIQELDNRINNNVDELLKNF